MTATITPDNADDKRIRWSSNNTNVATVTSSVNGEATVTAIASGTAVITVTTMDGAHTDTCTVTVKPIAGDPAKFIEAAFTQLEAGNYDAAIASFEAAYNADPDNNEAIAYSALAKLAAISTDAKVATLLKSRLGLTSYPQTMNALLDPSWLKKYEGASYVWTYRDLTPSANGYYVRANGSLTTSDGEKLITGFDYVLATSDNSDLDWINRWGYGAYILHDYNYDYNLEVTEFSDDGKYLIPSYYYDNREYYGGIPGTSQKYDLDWNSEERVLILNENGSGLAPEFNLPKWFEDSDMYTSSLVGGLQTTETLMYLLMANALEGNSAGLNGLLDGILDSVFGASFEAACSRIAELDMNDRIEIPEELIEGLGLEFILEEGFEAEIGRAEIQALTSALRLIKGTLQWIASYNLDSDLSFMKFDWATIDSPEDVISKIASKNDPFANGFLNARNNGSMVASKESFKKALTDINASYEYLVSDANTSYPQGIKNTMKDYCEPFNDGIEKLIAAINDGSKFHVSYDAFNNLSGTWPDSNGDITIDMGQFFTPGLFTLDKLVETRNNKPVFYIRDSDTGDEREMTAADVTAIKNLRNEMIAAEEAAEDSGSWEDWDEFYQLENAYYNNTYAGFMIKTSPMTTVVTIKGQEEMPETMLVNFGPDIAVALYEHYW